MSYFPDLVHCLELSSTEPKFLSRCQSKFEITQIFNFYIIWRQFYTNFYRLSGRLDLLTGQIKRNTGDDKNNYPKVLVYEDKDSSDENDFDTRNGDNDSTDQEEEEADVDDPDEDKMDDS